MHLLNKPIPSRFYSLDVIRGIAALTVLLWHWQHFLYAGQETASYSMVDQPFYQQLSIFYHWGWLAVDFFFSLSGFVFFWLYANSVAAKEISSYKFFVMRFSRLYPLHFLTLTLVIIGQYIYHSSQGAFFTYVNNDIYHFVLNIFMASNWGLQNGVSFNGPIWSVSVEVLLYVAFFMLCIWGKARVPVLIILVILGMGLAKVNSEIGRGVVSFFAGGIAFHAYNWLRQSPSENRLAPALWLVVTASWLWVVLEFQTGLPSKVSMELLGNIAPQKLQDIIVLIANKGWLYAITILLFPMTIISLALIETRRGSLGRRFSFIGHLSYSSYLIHFPLQLFFIIVAGMLGIDREYFYTKSSFIVFISILIPLCFASYYLFELPMQKRLRNVLSPKLAPSAA
ncbi:acyltransferase [Pseudomonas kairouanensis]|uniref:Acyltransferase n=1 Tax=Pseudomonas kairouanensis TaxID=2293832 RepID=A0A4Z0AG65_9PSED|nr:acyltransferase [Pseudomonas kairouanensis]TFY85752.1 acyltransferase [Pseudomonas kairouanensis]